MRQKKICLLGAFSVGKTSLIQRYVSSIFDEKYLTTVGVKIDKKNLIVGEQEVTLMIWDLAGEDDYNTLKTSHLRGAAGYVIVVDVTRPKTFEVALAVHEKAKEVLGDVPVIVALNKIDLEDQWAVSNEDIAALEENFTVLRTSAKTGQKVESIFNQLATAML
ncbi:MAG: Rab family GTPase [Pseudohongiellaceae bacterium]